MCSKERGRGDRGVGRQKLLEIEVDRRPIFYVCVASGWQIGNLGPLAALGWERVKGVALCYWHVRRRGGGRGHAKAPARYLKQWVQNTAPASVRLVSIDGDGNSFREWYEKIKAWAEPLATENPVFVLNTTGGMKPISLGAALGLEEVCADRGGQTELIYYRVKPKPGIEMLKGLLPDIDPAELTLSECLQIRGWREFAPEERARRESEAAARRARTAFLWSECADDPDGGKPKLLGELARRSAAGPRETGGSRRLFAWEEVNAIIDGIAGLSDRARGRVRQFAINFAAIDPILRRAGSRSGRTKTATWAAYGSKSTPGTVCSRRYNPRRGKPPKSRSE